ncbi:MULTISPECIES: hemin uptake protein HemP [Rhodobacterales]|uniref:hemin uptake protein HemP n=1 Tax=Rhodobacterales TaxID=204455 RepID=UPI001C9564D6|nr:MULTISPECIES: hemin uptake protein HemP [Rhodobacterales]MBY6088975.1 hemin uptake protein HemP [Maritimibacter alkaliphilus]MCA0922311.1 hemin uptake protein HemP [Pseudooceanicola nanhaiensis]
MSTNTVATQTLAAFDGPVHSAEELTGPDGLALIRLGDQVYTLRITRAGKLILTK